MNDQSMDIPVIPLARLQFEYRRQGGYPLEVNDGSLWHGVFGAALRQLYCRQPDLACRECRYLHGCEYTWLFQRIAPPDSEMLSNREAPAPHVFQLPDQAIGARATGCRIPLLLVADACQDFAAVVRAMALAGLHGLGKQRSRLRLDRVWQDATGATPVELADAQRILDQPQPRPLPVGDAPGGVRLRWLAACCLKKDRAGKAVDIAYLMMAMVRRVSLLQYFYTGKRLRADFRRLKAAAGKVRIRHDATRWETGSRYSARHGSVLNTSGRLGHLDLDLENARELWPYLQYSRYLGVGKNASMGQGRFALEVINSNSGDSIPIPCNFSYDPAVSERVLYRS